MIDTAHLLLFHSYFRWVVLLTILIQIIWIWKGNKACRTFHQKDFNLLLLFTLIYNIQLVLGWFLYLNSPIVDGFWTDIAQGIKNRQIRFFGLEHATMMNLGIILINISTFRSYKQIGSNIQFKKLWKAYIWIYLIILSSIPWSFSPLTSRPDFR